VKSRLHPSFRRAFARYPTIFNGAPAQRIAGFKVILPIQACNSNGCTQHYRYGRFVLTIPTELLACETAMI
jgi:hypothetical protein